MVMYSNDNVMIFKGCNFQIEWIFNVYIIDIYIIDSLKVGKPVLRISLLLQTAGFLKKSF